MPNKPIETKLAKSEHYNNYGPAEVLQFIIPAPNNQHSDQHFISGDERPRDILNFANQLAEVEQAVADFEATKAHPQFEYDEEHLQKELGEYIEVMDESSKDRWISYQINTLEGAKNGMLYWQNTAYTDFLKDILTAPNDEALDTVKTPFERLPFLQRIGRQDDDLAFGLKYWVKKYTLKQKKTALELLKNSYLPDWKDLQNKEDYINDNDKDKNSGKDIKVIRHFKRLITELDKKNDLIYGQYAKDLISAREKGLDLEKVPTPYSQKSWWQRLTNNEGQDNKQLINVLKLCNDDEFAAIKQLFANGFPTSETLYTMYHTYNQKSEEKKASFSYKRRNELFATLLKKYGKQLADDKYLGWQCYFENSLPIKGKEKEQFDKMSLKQVAEKYGPEQMWTHKGIILIKAKIKEALDNPKKLAEALIAARAVAQQRLSCFHVPLENRLFFAKMINEEYIALQQKDATRAGMLEINEQFRKLFAALQPQKGELEIIEQYRSSRRKHSNPKFIEARLASFDKLDNYLKSIFSADVLVAKKRLQEKFTDKKTAAVDINGGIIAAYRHADAVIAASNSGIHFTKGSPNVDMKAYHDEVVAELKEKSNQRMDNLSAKKSKRQREQR